MKRGCHNQKNGYKKKRLKINGATLFYIKINKVINIIIKININKLITSSDINNNNAVKNRLEVLIKIIQDKIR